MQKSLNLAHCLMKSRSLKGKLRYLDQTEEVKKLFASKPSLAQLSLEKQLALKQLIALNQAPHSLEQNSLETIDSLAEQLSAIDSFYREIGGIAGYQSAVEELLHAKEELQEEEKRSFYSPSFIDISKATRSVQGAIQKGIDSLPFLCEMYPLGGAADRLHLVDEATGAEMPAARLQFASKTLLEGLIADLEARENLYFQKTGERLNTPIAIMASHEKNNLFHIEEVLTAHNYFGRPKDRFKIFVQPLVPVVNEHGHWIWDGNGKLMLKPGGHGAIWKLAKDHGILDWFRSLGGRYALIRQINNPLAGLDYGLLAFAGFGYKKKMSFGFASCPRVCKAAEGVNVLVEKRVQDHYQYHLSNIEYCDFEKFGIEDVPIDRGEAYSCFTSNTNILFADLFSLEKAIRRCPFPGLLMNLKRDRQGRVFGRLESTMQNIADVFVERRKKPLDCGRLKKTYITYNDRYKTISTAKKAYVEGQSFNETPEKCFYDLMLSARSLLEGVCEFELPPLKSLEEELSGHPAFVFLYHPSLGPLFERIGRQLLKGSLSSGSELRLDLGEALITGLHVEGSFRVFAKEEGRVFTNTPSRVVLHNVCVKNQGVHWSRSRPFWNGRYSYAESLQIDLGVGSEFRAENICLEGPLHFVVQDGEKMVVTEECGNLRTMIEKKPSF